jgi:cysteine-rich repeat protein
MTLRRLLRSLVPLWSTVLSGCFVGEIGADVALECRSGDDCPADRVCLVLESRSQCVGITAPCIVVDGREAEPLASGSACGDGRICVQQACVAPRCGDGVVSGDETCDGDEGCRLDCTRCGDGVLDDGEVCDNGRNNSDDQPGACRSSCILASCGDAVVDPGEGCDDGDANSDLSAGACRRTCIPARCGDGVVDPGEACDDGDVNSDDVPDACRRDCELASCGDGTIDSGELCDDGVDNSDALPGACRATCQASRCGDFVRDPGEACDDGDANSDVGIDACRTTCELAGCGDGVVDSEERCDDGDTESGDGCRADCRKIEGCGDGLLDDGEVCDDGNANPRDGCDGCQEQVWHVDTLVTGTLEERAPLQVSVRPSGVSVDPLGRLYIVEATKHRVRRVELDGSLTTVAGNGTRGFSGDGGPATNASFASPRAVLADAMGRVFIADAGNGRVRRLEPDGTISTVVGGGFALDDGVLATEARLDAPRDLAFDASGRLIIAESGKDCGLRRLEPDGTITTVISTCPLAEGLGFMPQTVSMAPNGDLFVVAIVGRTLDFGDGSSTVDSVPEIWRVDAGGRAFFEADLQSFPPELGVEAISDVVIDRFERRFLAERVHVSEWLPDNTLRRVTEEQFSFVTSLALDTSSQLLVSDSLGAVVQRLEIDGTMSVVVGTGSLQSQRDGSATSTPLVFSSGFQGIAVDDDDRLIFTDAIGHRVLRLEPEGVLASIAGTGVQGTGGDGASALVVDIDAPTDAAIDTAGRVAFVELGPQRVRSLAPDGSLTTLVNDAGAIAFDASDRLILLRRAFPRTVLRREPTGVFTTLFGQGCTASSVDPVCAFFSHDSHIAAGRHEGLFVSSARRVYRLAEDGSGELTAIAGTGTCGGPPDLGRALAANLCGELPLAVDDNGHVFIADMLRCAVYRVGEGGDITRVAGTETCGSSGDGGPALEALLGEPAAMAVDRQGRLSFIERPSNRIRQVDVDGTIRTVAGPAHPEGPGPTKRARLYASEALVALPNNDVISVGALGRALRIDGAAVTVVVGYDAASPRVHGKATLSPLLEDARGMTWDPLGRALVMTERTSGQLRFVGTDVDNDGAIDDPELWTSVRVATGFLGSAGIAYEDRTDTFLVVSEEEHCVRRFDIEGELTHVVYGECGTPGIFPGYLQRPTHAIASFQTGAIYIADTGNHRVLRVEGGEVNVVVGDGSNSSAGEGSPARLFPVQGPRQLALDAYGNLYVTSTTTVRLVANVDGDADADGDDRVVSIFGGGDRAAFPESAALCVRSLAVRETGAVVVADACQGFAVEIVPGPAER